MPGDYTYKMAVPPEPAWTWKAYVEVVLREWRELMDSDPPEAALQAFFERHPCMLPGASGISSGSGSIDYSSWLPAVVSKPPLPSYAARIPDFMWLGHHSLADFAVLIEIEAPGKRWFTKAGQPTADFTQAHDQLRQWKTWFSAGHNTDAFKEFYGLDRGPTLRGFTPLYVLVYGRRQEATANRVDAQKRRHMQGSEESLMTYDRLRPDPECEQVMCVRRNVEGFTALSVPPTMTLGPLFAEPRSKIAGKSDAVSTNEYLSDVRKRFLLERMSYWDEWSKEERRCGRLGDFE